MVQAKGSGGRLAKAGLRSRRPLPSPLKQKRLSAVPSTMALLWPLT